jgi:hypothetical protein
MDGLCLGQTSKYNGQLNIDRIFPRTFHLGTFFYDTIVSLGMAICQAMTNLMGTLDKIMEEFEILNFMGARGPIQVPSPHWNPPP